MNKILQRSFLLLIIIFVFFQNISAQVPVPRTEKEKITDNWSVGFFYGLNLFAGDIEVYDYWPVKKRENERRGALNIFLNKELSPVFSLQAQYLKGELSGTKRYIRRWFETDMWETALGVDIDLVNLVARKKFNRRFSVHGMTGVGLMTYKTSYKELYTNKVLAVRKSTDWNVYSTLGLAYRFSPRWQVWAHQSIRVLDNDLLDNKKGGLPNDMYTYSSVGVTYKFDIVPSKRRPSDMDERLREKDMLADDAYLDVVSETTITRAADAQDISGDVALRYDVIPDEQGRWILQMAIDRGSLKGSGEVSLNLPPGILVRDVDETDYKVVSGERVATVTFNDSLSHVVALRIPFSLDGRIDIGYPLFTKGTINHPERGVLTFEKYGDLTLQQLLTQGMANYLPDGYALNMRREMPDTVGVLSSFDIDVEIQKGYTPGEAIWVQHFPYGFVPQNPLLENVVYSFEDGKMELRWKSLPEYGVMNFTIPVFVEQVVSGAYHFTGYFEDLFARRVAFDDRMEVTGEISGVAVILPDSIVGGMWMPVRVDIVKSSQTHSGRFEQVFPEQFIDFGSDNLLVRFENNKAIIVWNDISGDTLSINYQVKVPDLTPGSYSVTGNFIGRDQLIYKLDSRVFVDGLQKEDDKVLLFVTMPDEVVPNTRIAVGIDIRAGQKGGRAVLEQILPPGMTLATEHFEGFRMVQDKEMLKTRWRRLPADSVLHVNYELDIADIPEGTYPFVGSFIDSKGSRWPFLHSVSVVRDTVERIERNIEVYYAMRVRTIGSNAFLMGLSINKQDIRGSGEVEVRFPEGFKAGYTRLDSVRYVAEGNVARLIWDDLPADSIIKVDIPVRIGQVESGSYPVYIKGEFVDDRGVVYPFDNRNEIASDREIVESGDGGETVMLAGGLSMQIKVPESVTPEEKFRVHFIIEKQQMKGEANLNVLLPSGFTSVSVDDQGATREVAGRQVVYHWDQLPDTQALDVVMDLYSGSQQHGAYPLVGQISMEEIESRRASEIIHVVSKEDMEAVSSLDASSDTLTSLMLGGHPRDGFIYEAVMSGTIGPGNPAFYWSKSKRGIEYRVQIRAKKMKRMTRNELAQFYRTYESVRENYHQGWYKYSVGSFEYIDEAIIYRNRLKAEGISDAFVVAFKNGKRIELWRGMRETFKNMRR